MKAPWVPEIPVDEALARRLIAAQFPAFGKASIRLAGTGWDNAAYLIDERYVFRFPQRSISAPLIEREVACMPALAGTLPLAVPNPVFAGNPQFEYPYRFAGYEIIAGTTACSRQLDYEERRRLAHDLATFLRALHDIDPGIFETTLPPDVIGRLDPGRLKADEEPLTGPLAVVHGDLYARHLVLDEDARLRGVIDWGDLHFGHPAVDLAVVHLMIPPRDHERFLDVYGEVDERTWRFARYRALHHAKMTLQFGTAIGDEALKQASETALRYIDA